MSFFEATGYFVRSIFHQNVQFLINIALYPNPDHSFEKIAKKTGHIYIK